MKVVVLNARYATGMSKKNNKPYAGCFVDFVRYDAREKVFKPENVFIDASVLAGYVPEVGATLNIETEFGSKFISSVTVINDPELLAQFIMPFQAALQQMKKPQ